MNPESSHKFFYRYVISESEKLTLISHQRKLRKAAQHSTTDLLIDFTSTEVIEKVLEAPDFFELFDHSPYAKHFLCKPQQSEVLIRRLTSKNISLFFWIKTEKDLAIAQSLKTSACFLLSPQTCDDLNAFLNLRDTPNCFWSFRPYNKTIRRSVALKDIYQIQKKNHFVFNTLSGLEIWNSDIPTHYELEPRVDVSWCFATAEKTPLISVIIPSFNNVIFLSQVLQHLFEQTLARKNYEIIVVEDGGTDRSSELLQALFRSFKDQVNLKFIYWPKQHQQKGDQQFFRAGLARNLAVQYCESEKIVFLDSDMLTPPDFLETALHELDSNDLIQFQRHHIHQNISSTNPRYENIRLHTDTYIEEKNYWGQLFQSDNWTNLANYWKYTCTYALGLHKKKFYEVGRFKKYYVSYGFEDTDLGYEFFKRSYRFKLIKKPLLHLTSYDRMQYKNSQFRRQKLLRKTASLFYLQHLDPQIYELFGNFYRFEKPLRNSLRDLF